jgi:hypothetical protein
MSGYVSRFALAERAFCCFQYARFVGNTTQSVIFSDMSLRVSDALVTHAAFWSSLQMEYDLWQASRKPMP